eukprot:6242731-Amphidinium_carterae.1
MDARLWMRTLARMKCMAVNFFVDMSMIPSEFQRQQVLLQNLLAPLVSRWVPLAESLSNPSNLVAALVRGRGELEIVIQLRSQHADNERYRGDASPRLEQLHQAAMFG